ncbi:MAG: response regulator [Xanthomonadales bacterium]|nr:response regulator [Xanthomonadales bacterium]
MKKILIIEDDARVAQALSVRLKSAGYRANTAYDAATGLMQAKKIQPDLVLLDINLPAGDGFMVAERIMEQLETMVPIVFITASKSAELLQRAKDMGAAGYFEKPYDAKELLDAIEEILNG